MGVMEGDSSSVLICTNQVIKERWMLLLLLLLLSEPNERMIEETREDPMDEWSEDEAVVDLSFRASRGLLRVEGEKGHAGVEAPKINPQLH